MKALKTLVVDDSVSILKLLEVLLHDLGIEHCEFANCGEAAIEKIAHQFVDFDLIFVDLNMPGVDGMQLIQFLAGYRFPGSVVIISSLDKRILNMAATLATEYGLKLAGSLEKPIKIIELENILSKVAEYSAIKHPDNLTLLPEDLVSNALESHDVVAHFQPKVDRASSQVKGLEALARLRVSGEPQLISANRFIPVIESRQLSSTLLTQMLERTLEAVPELIAEFGNETTISMNISPLDLLNNDLPRQLSDRLKHYACDPRRIVIEITESAAIEYPTQLETLNRLRIRGFGLSLDDFGTGYTNIHQLRDLPYTEVKLDRSLSHNIDADKLSQVISGSLFDIFSQLHLDVVVEGIEKQTEADFFEKIAYPLCFQGYAIAHPNGLDEILGWHRKWKAQAHHRYGT